MNRVFVTGDVHGKVIPRLSNQNFPLAKKLDRTDLVIIAGDFGSIWRNTPDNEEIYILNWLNDRPFTTLIVGGNHENWDRLHAIPLITKFGVDLGEIRPNVFFVPNGTLLEYAGKKIFFFGGAMSTDKHHRTEGVSWWAREIPSYAEMDFGTQNLEMVNYEVDVIVTHTMPIKSVMMCVMDQSWYEERTKDPTSNYLSFIKEHTKYREWYCGHFHVNKTYDDVTVLYDHIIEVGQKNYHSFGKLGG